MKIIKYSILIIIILAFTFLLGDTYIRDLPLSDCPKLDMARADSNVLKHEYGGLEIDASNYNGILKIVSGSAGYLLIGADSSGAVVITDSTQALTNKTYSGTALIITGDGSISDSLHIGGKLNISNAIFYLADDQISGDKIENGTIDYITITDLISDSINIRVANIDTLRGHSPIIVLDSMAVTGQVSATILTDGTISITSGNITGIDSINITKASIDTIKSEVEFLDSINVPIGKLKIGETAITSTASELNILDGVTADKDELNYLDISGKGKAEAGKVLTLDNSKQLDSLNVASHITLGGELRLTEKPIVLKNNGTINETTSGLVNLSGGLLIGGRGPNYCLSTNVGGTANAITLDYIPSISALAEGLMVTFIADSSNTGATTVTINALVTKNIYEAHDISALEANDIRANMMVQLIYDGVQFQQISQSGN
ncbi:MAG: hypothetical protein H8D22_04375 [Candidatus Cloacimonetes bacterium]|nr:hypothetical protein [Candidatus Cloacimonadota bacterium]